MAFTPPCAPRGASSPPRETPLAPGPETQDLVASPFLHVEGNRLYNPLTDASLEAGDPAYDAVHALRSGNAGTLPAALASRLREGLWAVRQGRTSRTGSA